MYFIKRGKINLLENEISTLSKVYLLTMVSNSIYIVIIKLINLIYTFLVFKNNTLFAVTLKK